MNTRAIRYFVVLGAVTGLAAVLCACSSPTGQTRTQPADPSGSASAKPGAATPSPSATVEPVLVVASMDVDGAHVTASGYVQGIIQDTGTCTYTFTKTGASPITVEHDAVADRATTSCGTIQADAAQFARGSWSVTLGYASGGSDYHSAPVELEVP